MQVILLVFENSKQKKSASGVGVIGVKIWSQKSVHNKRPKADQIKKTFRSNNVRKLFSLLFKLFYER